MTSNEASQRLRSIDALRGLVIVLMALDHARDFFGPTVFPPTALQNPEVSPALFLTRWVTHFCAPVFVFLAGTSAFLWWTRRGRDGVPRRDLSLFLLTRGLWLILIEFAVVSPSWFIAVYLDPGVGFQGGYFAVAQVIWAIGVSMVVLSALVWLPVWGIGAFGALLVCGHNLLDGPLAGLLKHETFLGAPTGGFGKLAVLLHGAQSYFRLGEIPVLVVYAVIPWPGVTALGFVFGSLVRAPARRRALGCLAIGLSATALFVLLRGLGLYGEPAARATYDAPLRSALSLVNTTKYPPSLQYLLMTLGPAIATVPLLEGIAGGRAAAALTPLVTFGRVPFFFYILHIPLINAATVTMAWTQDWPASWWFAVMGGGRAPEGYRLNLWWVYLAWIGAVLALYPACRWFARFRAKHTWWWLRYL